MTDFADLEARMRARLTSVGITRQYGILRAVSRDGVPLSSAQQRMFYHWLRYPTSTTYTVCVVLRLEGDIDLETLTGAFEDLVERHEVLRTRYATDAEGNPVQHVDAPYSPITGMEAPGLGGYAPGTFPAPAVVDINIATTTGRDGQLRLDGSLAYATNILAREDAAELAALWIETLETLSGYAAEAWRDQLPARIVERLEDQDHVSVISTATGVAQWGDTLRCLLDTQHTGIGLRGGDRDSHRGMWPRRGDEDRLHRPRRRPARRPLAERAAPAARRKGGHRMMTAISEGVRR